MDETERKAAKAAYMREYNSRPGNREKKQLRDRLYAETNRERTRQNALRNYYADREKKISQIKRRECHLKRKALAYLGGACSSCGEDHPATLQFHHKDPTQKSFTVTTKQLSCVRKYPWEVVEKELDKCELLCANCHFLTHNSWLDEWLQEPLDY